jgi:hypothetical protein
MGNQERSTTETLQGVEVATRYLEEAEETLWDLSNNTSSPEVAEEIDELLEDLWELQNKTSELKDNMEKNLNNFEY